MKCRICKRPLKNPKYVEIGMGPICARKNSMDFVVEVQDPSKNHVYDEFDGTEDIVAERMPDGRIKTNVRQIRELHSPNGFEMGYGGSGPADFAYNILLKFGVKPREAEILHQDFKWKFVARLDQKNGGRIAANDVRIFLKENGCVLRN